MDFTWDAPVGFKIIVILLCAIAYGFYEGSRYYFRKIPRSSPIQEIIGLSLAVYLGLALSKIL